MASLRYEVRSGSSNAVQSARGITQPTYQTFFDSELAMNREQAYLNVDLVGTLASRALRRELLFLPVGAGPCIPWRGSAHHE